MVDSYLHVQQAIFPAIFEWVGVFGDEIGCYLFTAKIQGKFKIVKISSNCMFDDFGSEGFDVFLV